MKFDVAAIVGGPFTLRFDDGAPTCRQGPAATQGAEIVITLQGCAGPLAAGAMVPCGSLCVVYRPPNVAVAPHLGDGDRLALRISISAGFTRRVLRPCFGPGDVARHFPAGTLGELPAAIVEECSGGKGASPSPLLLDGLLRQLIASAARCDAGQGGRCGHASGGPPAWLVQGVALIEQRFREAIKIESVARRLGVDPTHFSRAFRRFRGVSPKRYLLLLRLREAAGQLSAGSPPLSDLAQQLGFCDQAHFGRAFKSWAGRSPDAYRRSRLALSPR